MKVSIITPSLNQGKFLRQTIDSVMNQKGPFEIEHIVMDGGSTDNTLHILQEAEKRMNGNRRVRLIWTSKKDKGQSDAINKGLRLATGEIVAYINSDDYYEPGAFAAVIKHFRLNPAHRWLSGYCRIINAQNKPIQSLISRYKNFWLNHYSYRSLLILNFISQPATFWRRDIMKDYGNFQENLHLAMDYEYWLRLGHNNTPIIIKSVLANFRVHGSSKGGLQYRRQFAEDQRVCEQYTSNNFIHLLHRGHNFLTTYIYKLSRS